MIYDMIIAGAGPSGITASVYAARLKINFLVITKDIGGQAARSSDIENYTGYQFIAGPELANKFEEHIKHFNVSLKEGEEVIEIEKQEGIFRVKTNKSEYFSKAIIVASGKNPRPLNVPGEKEFKNKGLTYCAICDGPLFADKNVAVIGGGNSALDSTLQLTKIAKKVYLVNINKELGGDAIMREQVKKTNNVIVMNSTETLEVIGDKLVSGLKVKRDGKEEIINIEGIFIEVGLIPVSDFIKIVEKNKIGEIKINTKNETSMPGVFACGDVTDVSEKQIIIAAGEGAKATLSAYQYLLRHGESGMESWKCTVCGYIYDPSKGDPEHNVAPGTKFEDLPADWVCPECGVGKDMFVRRTL